ncbi:MarR family transcriptional regulator [Filibacter tadaridae]|uniref:Putative HTH-type transcriptional regulator YusO n=1 Tax=Filibacter tadaridae TaxID=2483811 RepID=A0A3P5WSG2_9BACL|nr:MarR family transcriptional regulator [Filibacter tadaridae]VDC24142.1 putative HTH-type transcriptional regulator YusO [Filibacter tadaridae]
MDRQRSLHDLEDLFWQLSRKMEHLWKDIYAKTFPGSQSRIMYLLEQNGPRKMSELANSIHITAGAITTASNLLIENGYITRLRNEQDRRVVHLDLTDKGKTTLNELQNEGREIMKLIFHDISDADLERMHTLFKQASSNIDNR